MQSKIARTCPVAFNTGLLIGSILFLAYGTYWLNTHSGNGGR